MRKFIIDTDTASDDAVAIMLGLLSEQVCVLGITTVCGNIPLETATDNALMTAEVCRSEVAVYKGAAKPLIKQRADTACVHGKDGMGEMDLIHPKNKASDLYAVDYILQTVKDNPGEIEIVALGPVTNIALAILKDPDCMKKVKHIWSMGTSGFGPGNATPVAEFNVFIDAESYKIMLESGIPITIIGFDLCLGEAAVSEQELNSLSVAGTLGKFACDCTSKLKQYNFERSGVYQIDLPDAVAMAVALWEDIVLDKRSCNCYCCTLEKQAYGQVIVADSSVAYEAHGMGYESVNATVIKTIDAKLFKDKMCALLSKF